MVKIEPCLGYVIVTTELSPLFQFQKQSVNSGLFSLKKKGFNFRIVLQWNQQYFL